MESRASTRVYVHGNRDWPRESSGRTNWHCPIGGPKRRDSSEDRQVTP